MSDHGGVLGRKVVHEVEDDQYDPAETVALTQLVEQDEVFAIFTFSFTGAFGKAKVFPSPRRGASERHCRRGRQRAR